MSEGITGIDGRVSKKFMIGLMAFQSFDQSLAELRAVFEEASFFTKSLDLIEKENIVMIKGCLTHVSAADIESPHWNEMQRCKMIEHALMWGWPINHQIATQTKWTLLHESGFHQRLELTEFLLEQGADPHLKTRAKETALHLAAEKFLGGPTCVPMIDLLLKYHSSLEARDEKGFTPFLTAIINESLEFEALAQYGSNLFVRNDEGFNALDLSILKKDIHSTKRLIEWGFDPFEDNAKGWNPVKMADRLGFLEGAALLKGFMQAKEEKRVLEEQMEKISLSTTISDGENHSLPSRRPNRSI